MEIYNIKILVRKHIPECIHIDAVTDNAYGWTEDEFLSELTSRTCNGLVAVNAVGNVVGYLVYSTNERYKTINLLHIGVHPEVRRKSVGTVLITKLIGFLNKKRMNRMVCLVPDSMYDVHAFLRMFDFKARKVVKTPYISTEDDGYYFEYKLQNETPEGVMATEEDGRSFAE